MSGIDEQLLDTVETKAAAAAAAAGGWGFTYGRGEPARVWSGDDADAEPVATIGGFLDAADAAAAAEHIAAADPPTVLALIAEIRRLRHRQGDADLVNEAIRWKGRALGTDQRVRDVLNRADDNGEASVLVTDVRAALFHPEGKQ